MRGAVDGRFGDADDDDDAARRPLAPLLRVKKFLAFSFHLLKPRFSILTLHALSRGDRRSVFIVIGCCRNSRVAVKLTWSFRPEDAASERTQGSVEMIRDAPMAPRKCGNAAMILQSCRKGAANCGSDAPKMQQGCCKIAAVMLQNCSRGAAKIRQ